MKKKTKKFLPYWIIFGSLGVVALIVGIILHFPAWILWLSSVLPLGGVALWIALYVIFARRSKTKKSAAFVGNRAVYERVSREINEAITRYLQSVNRIGFLKQSALYERPWFLVCGPEKSGKTQLLASSGLHFPLTYPSEQDGMVLDTGSGISWNFGNDAVWVDMPGAMMSEGNTDEWQATVHALRQVRSERAIDGVVMVIDAKRVMDADPAGVKNMAGFLRKRLDELIVKWGIEFPVYLVLSKSDQILGFNELFRDPAGKWHEQILGASLSGEQQKGMPRHAFLEEFDLLTASLHDMRLRMLAKERNEQARRRICRFVIQYEGMQQKLGNLVAELFKPSSYEGKPVFRGFYFTSCREEAEEKGGDTVTPINLSNTIMNHPLNPHRTERPDATRSGRRKRTEIRSFFTSPLFNEVIPSGSALVKKTQKTTRRELMRHYSLVGVILFCAFCIGWFIVYTAKNAISLNNRVKQQIAQARGEVSSRAEAYRMLGRMGRTVAELKRIDDKGVPISMSLGMYKGNRVLNELKKQYFSEVKKYIVGPAMRYLEFRIKRYTESFGELTSDDYNALYSVLKGYLSISEAVSERKELIDTVSLRPILLESIKYVLLAKEHKSRLSKDVETVLQENIGLYLSFLKSGEFPPVQENQHLVSRARKRLCRLPNAQALYESVRARLSMGAQLFTLDDILGRSGPGILQSSNTISLLYTQQGWDESVSTAIKESCTDPYKIDWVIGTTREQMPETELDPDKLYEDMKNVYFRDVKEQWLQFIGSVSMEPFGDIQRAGRILQKLGREQSELAIFFEKVAELTRINEETAEKEVEVPGIVKKVAAKKTKKLKKLGLKPESFLKRKKGAVELADAFAPLRSFVRSESGSLGGLEGYCDKIITLAEKLTEIESGDGDNVVATFNGKDSDPLFSAWTFTKNELAGMPDEFAGAIDNLLLQPIEYTGRSVSKRLRKQMNTLWQNDVANLFAGRFAGMYPFTGKEDETVFSEVMDFFRPSTGILWGFYDRRLSPFLYKSNKKWETRTLGTVEVVFDPKLIETLKHAEKISAIFFQPDGTIRRQKITLSPMQNNKNKAVLKVAEGEYEILPGSGSKAQFTWPIESGSKDITLKIFANERVVKEFTYSGQWGLMRLFSSARVNVMNQTTFVAKWQINVQNMYTIYLALKIKVSGAGHPFSESIFGGFDVPMEIVVDGKAHS